ncbi:MAG: MFS transporter [Chloroflexi bacterium]|nr:MAG: MFS transporter [Chloroflexota bacterium]
METKATDRISPVAERAGQLARTRVRYGILALLFFGVVINYLDRANLALALPVIGVDLHLNAVEKGLILSAFGWSYVLMQIPGGIIIDRFGPRLTFAVSLFTWSIVTMLQGLARSAAVLIGLRVVLGITEAPAFPLNSRVVGTWFPARERGFAIGVYTAGEFGGLAILTPVLAFILSTWSWPAMFAICGVIGVLYAVFWFFTYRDPKQSRRVNQAELDYIREGGGMVETVAASRRFSWADVIVLLSHRQLWGIYIGQFAVGVTLWFFLTWFPTYLVQARGLSILHAGFYASVPYISAMLGVLFGGVFSDGLIRRGASVGVARKTPVILGLLGASTIMLANYINDINLVIAVMAIAFFCQGMSNMSWTLVTEMAPRELQGLTGGVFNFFANIPSIVTPLVIGFILAATNSFNGALIFITVVDLIGVLSYIFIIGKVYRIELKPALGL